MPPELRLQLLGSTSITLGEQPLAHLRSRTAEALLIYLALHKQTFSRQVLADFFWDERSQKQALSNLRTILTMLRRELDDHLVITRHTVAFNHDGPYWVDTREFTRLIAGKHPEVANLQAAVDLYRGDFLSGFFLRESHGFEAWGLMMREQLRQAAVTALRRLNGHFLATAQYQRGAPYAQRLLHISPLDELAQRQLMELLWRGGQRTAALQVYENGAELLQQELAVEPDPASTLLYRRIRSSSFPPPSSVPVPLTPFVGRDEELARLFALLSEPHTRLVTIVGPGGMGKTRLLIEAARLMAQTQPGRFMNGVFFVPLADIPSADFLPTTLAQHIGVSFQGPASAAEQLVSFLHSQEMLLALDNVEHLITPTSLRLLARIAEEAPGTRLLVSSRARLGLHGEQLLDLEGLSVPPAETTAPHSFAAVRLFTEQVAAVRPDFVPDDAELASIAHLCRLVEGMPLALELAAAGARHFHCRDIVAQVQERLDWEYGHSSNRPRRHQNLHAVFAHSWSLLGAEDQAAARRLAVFAGPFDAAAAQTVARISAGQLATLRDHSLLGQVRPGWFSLHPLIRRFLAQKLDAVPGEAEETARRHARYVVDVVSPPRPDTNMESHYDELQTIMAEQHDQIIAAALWLARRRDFSGRALVTLVERLMLYFSHHGQHETWKVVLAQLLKALAEGEEEPENAAWLSAVLRSRLAGTDIELHAYRRAQTQFEQLLPEAMRIENGALISYCHHMLGRLAARRGAFAAAFHHLAAALPSLEQEGYGQHYLFPVYRTWTEVALLAGEVQQARVAADTAYRLALEVDSEAEAAPVYAWALGEIARLEGNLHQARAHLQRAADLAHDKGRWQEVVTVDYSLATVLAELGEEQRAVSLSARAYDAAAARQDQRLMALAARAQGRAAECSGNSLAAADYYRHSLTLLTAIGDEGERARTQDRLDHLNQYKAQKQS
ncbi:MAG: ATP-binding protein [Chloroflexota bacterium]